MHENRDERGIPISAGIPPLVVFAVIAGVIVILAIVTMVFANSSVGHVWPASGSTTLDLNQ